MKRWLLVLAMIALVRSTAAPAAASPAEVAQPFDHGVGSITRELIAMNAGTKWGKPAQKFAPGNATARKAPSAKRTAHGFEIRFGNGSPVSTPAYYNGRVYTSGGFNSREFYSFDATSGKGAWALDLSDDGPSASACADGVCVFNTESCTVFAVDAATGKQRWSWFVGDPQTSSPTIAGGRVFTSYPAGAVDHDKEKPPTATHVLAAFDLQTGRVVWQDWLDADVISAPVAVAEFLYVSTFNGTVIKIEQATGKIRYASRARATSAPVVEFVAGLESMYFTRRADAPMQRAHAAVAAGPVGAEEQIVRTDHNEPETRYATPAKKADYLDEKVQDSSALKGAATAHDAGNGFSGGAPAAAAPDKAKAQIGQSNVATLQAFQGSRILHLAALNVSTMGDEVVATNPEDGKRLWSHKLDGNVAKDGGFLGTPPLAAGKHVLLATLHGQILDLDPATGKTEATYQVGGSIRSQPIVAGGWIYVGTDDGRLVAIDTGDRALTGWPMWGGNASRTGALEQK